MAGARFSQINLVVRHMEVTLDFYRRLGVEIPPETIWESGGAAQRATAQTAGEVALEFDSRSLAKTYNEGFAAERGRVVIGLELESREAVDALWELVLAEGGQGLQPPHDAFWGARCAIIEDPDGNPVSLSSPVDPGRRGPPPAL